MGAKQGGCIKYLRSSLASCYKKQYGMGHLCLKQIMVSTLSSLSVSHAVNYFRMWWACQCSSASLLWSWECRMLPRHQGFQRRNRPLCICMTGEFCAAQVVVLNQRRNISSEVRIFTQGLSDIKQTSESVIHRQYSAVMRWLLITGYFQGDHG